jgi:hypothetical protein
VGYTFKTHTTFTVQTETTYNWDNAIGFVGVITRAELELKGRTADLHDLADHRVNRHGPLVQEDFDESSGDGRLEKRPSSKASPPGKHATPLTANRPLITETLILQAPVSDERAT